MSIHVVQFTSSKHNFLKNDFDNSNVPEVGGFLGRRCRCDDVHVVRLQGPQREAERDDGVERWLPEDDGQSVGTNKDAAVRNKRSER